MALSDVTVTFNLTQLLGEAFDARRTRAYVKTNVANGTLMDTSTGEIRLGDQKVTIADDGTGSFTTWAPGVDGNPTSWQTSLVVEYPRTGQRDRQVRTFGPYTITASVDLSTLEPEQAVPAEYLTQVTEELQTYSDAAASSASAAAASAALAQDISNIDTPDALVATLVEDSGSATASALSASYAPRLDGRIGEPWLPVAGVAGATIEGKGNYANLSWNGSGGVSYVIRDMTEADRNKWMSVPTDTSNFWLSTTIVYPRLGEQSTSPWHIVGCTTDSKRVMIIGAIFTGRDMGPWVLVNGQPLTALPYDFDLVYDGSLGGWLVTFPDAQMRSIEFLSSICVHSVVVDAGRTAQPYRREGSKVAFIADSWGEGTTQGGSAPVHAYLQAATSWRVFSNGQGGTGYVSDPGAGKSVFGSTERLDAILAESPDLVVFFGSINDNGSSIDTAAAAAFAKVSAAGKKAVVFGPQLASAGQSTNLAALEAAAASNPDVLAVVDPTTWQTAGLVGPSDLNHPSPAGVAWTARNIVREVRAAATAAGLVGY